MPDALGREKVKPLLGQLLEYLGVPREKLRELITPKPSRVTEQVPYLPQIQQVLGDVLSKMVPYETDPENMAMIGMFLGPKATGFPTATGKFSSLADKMPRFEISDAEAALKLSPEVIALAKGKTSPMAEVLEHPELYKQYPGLQKVPVHFEELEKGHRGQYIPSDVTRPRTTPQFLVNPEVVSEGPAGLMNTLLHEIQHYVQEVEGFAPGGGLKNIMQVKETMESTLVKLLRDTGFGKFVGKKFEDIQRIRGVNKLPIEEQMEVWDSALKEFFGTKYPTVHAAQQIVTFPPEAIYKSLAGEVESRSTELRRALSPEQRLRTPPYSEEQIPTGLPLVLAPTGFPQKYVVPTNREVRLDALIDQLRRKQKGQPNVIISETPIPKVIGTRKGMGNIIRRTPMQQEEAHRIAQEELAKMDAMLSKTRMELQAEPPIAEIPLFVKEEVRQKGLARRRVPPKGAAAPKELKPLLKPPTIKDFLEE